MGARSISISSLLLLCIVSGSGLGSGLLAGHETPPTSASGTDAPSDWAVCEEGTWAPTQHAYGLVSDSRELRMVAPASLSVIESGTIKGQRVRKGEALAKIQSPEIADLVDQLVAQRHTASLTQKMLHDTLQRFEQQLTTQEQVLSARVDAGKAEAAYTDRWNLLAQTLAGLGEPRTREQVERMLDQDGTEAVLALASVVRAPISGVVMQLGALPGLTLPGGSLLFAIEDTSGVFVDVGVIPSRLEPWKTGTATANLLGDDIHLEHLDTIARLDPATGLLLVRFHATIPDNRQADGAIVRVECVGKATTVVWVPREAVVGRNNQAWCLIDDGSDKPKPVRVRVGPAQNGRIPVLSGLDAGQRVLVHNAYEVLYRDLKELVKFQD